MKRTTAYWAMPCGLNANALFELAVGRKSEWIRECLLLNKSGWVDPIDDAWSVRQAAVNR